MKKDHGALLGKKVISCAVSLLMTATMFPSSSVWADDGARELGKSDFLQYHARSLGPGGDGDLLDNSLDNNTSTYTNSSYIGAGDLTGVELANPQYYCFHLNTPMSISKVGVQPRSSGHLNQLKAFKVYVGSTEEDLVLVKEGTVTTADMTYVEFTPVTGSVVKIEMTPEEGGNCVSTAEVEIWGAEIQTSEVNKTTLQEQIDAANELKEEDYTEESWAKLQETLNKANEINEKEEATQEEVDKAAEDLKNAIEALEEAPDVQNFKDVPTNAWFYDAIEYVSDKGYMTGMDPDAKPLAYFGAVEELSRAHFATLLYRIAGSPEVTYENKFKDVPDGQFYTDAVIWASNEGIITGYTEGPDKGKFGASDNITREQIAVMMYRYAQYAGMDTSAKGDLTEFPDGNKTSAFAKEAMAWAVGAGLISGNEDGTLAPQGEVSRAVCATIIMRFDINFNK